MPTFSVGVVEVLCGWFSVLSGAFYNILTIFRKKDFLKYLESGPYNCSPVLIRDNLTKLILVTKILLMVSNALSNT